MRLANRIVDILCCLQGEGAGLGVTEISQRVGIPKSTAHGLLQAVGTRGLVAQDPVTQRYTLGLGLLAMASALLRDRSILMSPAQGPMERLRDLSGETVCLHVPFGLERVCLSQVESPHALRYTMEIGKPFPLYCGATGKLLLAYMTDQEIRQVIAATSLASLTPRTVTDPAALLDQLEAIRSLGYAISFEERIPLVSAAAAPVRDRRGQVIGCVTIYGPRMRLDDERIGALIPGLLATARDISETVAPAAQ